MASPLRVFKTRSHQFKIEKINSRYNMFSSLPEMLNSIGDLIPRDNKYWKLWRHVRKITDIVTSPRLRKEEANEF